jgi:hypothetical protein
VSINQNIFIAISIDYSRRNYIAMIAVRRTFALWPMRSSATWPALQQQLQSLHNGCLQTKDAKELQSAS